MATDTSVFARIIKQEKQADGTLLVTGIATDDTLDIDEQICDPQWLERAMPAWFKYGNIREQHSNIAAGVATKYEMDGTQHIVTARVVDPSSVSKVEAGVLKGFSIGIRNPRISTDKSAPGGRIVDGEIVEVSLVDRPANPSCLLELAKTVGGVVQQTETLIEKDAAMERCSKCDKAYKSEDLADGMCEDCKDLETETEESTEPDISEGEESSEMKSVEADPVVEETVEVVEEAVEEKGATTEAIPARTGEESSQVPGEESSQAIGEESSRLGGVAGEAGKKKKSKTAKRLKSVEATLARIEMMLQESKSADSATKAISVDSVDELNERLAKVEKSASRGPVRMAPKAALVEVNDKAVKAAEFRAKAAATTDPALASAYLLAAAEAETTN